MNTEFAASRILKKNYMGMRCNLEAEALIKYTGEYGIYKALTHSNLIDGLNL